jgi:hypothetical protein
MKKIIYFKELINNCLSLSQVRDVIKTEEWQALLITSSLAQWRVYLVV